MPVPARFDAYAEAVARGDDAAAGTLLTVDEVAGPRLFIGGAGCIDCHAGPLFTTNAFPNTGVPDAAGLRQDHGRALGARRVLADELNCLSAYSDAAPSDCPALRFLKSDGHELERAFRPPTPDDLDRDRRRTLGARCAVCVSTRLSLRACTDRIVVEGPMTQAFAVERIDHVELVVRDQHEAAHWYGRTFGMRIVAELEDWAAGGPLMIEIPGTGSKLALFAGEPPGFRPPVGFRRVAFGVDGAGFLRFLEHVAAHGVHTDDGELVHELRVIDHGHVYSVYFADPDGNRFEVTTFDRDTVRVGRT
jgi:catechol 2,3-dioxygenase-like lactoylglutathione lyase family enzyme